MTIRDYLRILRERWAIVTFAVVLCLLAATATYALRPAEYTARLSMYVSATGAEDAAAAAYGAQLAVQRVKSYVVLIGSRRVSQDVVERLGLPESPDQLSKQITASTPVDTQVIDLEVVDRSPERAAAIANAVADDFTEVSSDLTRNAQVGQSTVALRVVQPAAVPTSPSSTGLSVTLLLGLLAGLVIGVAAAFVRNTLDTTIRSRERLVAATGAPVLAVVGYDLPRRARAPEGTGHPPAGGAPRPSTEDLRKLRTNLRFRKGSDPAEVVVVTSPTSGEGKTTLAVDLARAVAAAGLRVLLVEGDLRRPVLTGRLGLEASPGFAGVLSGEVHVLDAIQRSGEGAPDVLTAGDVPTNPIDLLGAESREKALVEVRAEYDVVLVDSPPLEPYTDAAVLAAAADGTVLVCRSHAATHGQAVAAVEALHDVSAKLLGAVLVVMRRPARRPDVAAQRG